MDAGGLAEASGEIKPGDFILAVNGTNTQTVTDIKQVRGLTGRGVAMQMMPGCVHAQY
jgi:C-terminal processing protease CtpA/Prc